MYSEQVVSSEKEVVSCAQLLNALYSTYADAITLTDQVAWFDYIQYPYIPICLCMLYGIGLLSTLIPSPNVLPIFFWTTL